MSEAASPTPAPDGTLFRGSTLVDLLRWRADTLPKERVFLFLNNGEEEGEEFSYAELDRRARAIGTLLQSDTPAGERALLLYPPGLDFIAAFFGSLYAGLIAVPAYPPHPARLKQLLPGFCALIADAQPAVVLTESKFLAKAREIFAAAPELGRIRWIATDETLPPDEGGDAAWMPPALTSESIAFLQYTSGSTALPKGAMVSHRNVFHNERMIQAAFRLEGTDQCGVGWLPLYHDMGLIGNVFAPLYNAAPMVLMPPAAFLQRPVRWLQAITRYRATTSGGPNFAYELCTERITAEQKQVLDLSRWKVAFNGAEPIRKETLDRFTEAFESCGFRAETFCPCYGL
ncbi:MAG TPA: AMP-binding protein, partial [Thermoanaerobaculia bacterium]|nr:AMP-binding protein [Thermoanaerobaculia bacterium]